MRNRHRFAILFFPLIIVLFLCAAAQADDPLPPDLAKERIGVVPKGEITSQQAAETSAFLKELAKVTEEFRGFGKNFINVAGARFLASESNKKVEKIGSMYVARYYKIDPSYMDIQVKPYESKNSPYLGILKYIEQLYECSAPTKEGALTGKFVTVDSTRITTIFRYGKDGWGSTR